MSGLNFLTLPSPSPCHLHQQRRPASSRPNVLEGRAAVLYCLGSTWQVAGPCPNVRVVPSFTKRAGSTSLVRERPRASRPHPRGGEVERERGSGVKSWELGRAPSSSPWAQPPGINTSKEQGPYAAGKERDPGGREGREARRGVAGAQREGAGRRGCCSALSALGARLCRARCT